MQTRRIPTLEDVAKAAGVSTATVSRCLNTTQKVTEETRKRVMQAVDALGYTPNHGARAMASATRRTSTIGAIIPTMENAMFARGLQAFQEALHARGYTLLVSCTGYSPEVEAEQIRNLVARGADGLLLIGYARDASVYDYLAQRGVPMLLSWAMLKEKPHASIGFDNRAAMRMLAEEVLSMGHRDIAVISAVTAGNDRASERLEGIRDAVAAFGGDPTALQVIETAYEIESGAAAFARLMEGRPRPTVVMCANDVLAAGAVQRAREMGLDVPGDISVTGFDDIELSRIVTPQLTTVHLPHAEMGRLAAETLVEVVEAGTPARSVELFPTLRLRESLKPPA